MTGHVPLLKGTSVKGEGCNLFASSRLMRFLGIACGFGLAPGLQALHAEDKDASGNQPPTILEFTVKLDTITSGFDGKTCWVAPRAGVVPGPSPSVVLTMQKLLLKGSDIFYRGQ